MKPLSQSQLKEVADLLLCGMICYVHTETDETEYFPQEMIDRELWQEVMDKIDADYSSYLRIEPIHSSGNHANSVNLGISSLWNSVLQFF